MQNQIVQHLHSATLDNATVNSAAMKIGKSKSATWNSKTLN